MSNQTSAEAAPTDGIPGAAVDGDLLRGGKAIANSITAPTRKPM